MNIFLRICFFLLVFSQPCQVIAQDRPFLTLHPGMELSRDLRIAPYEYNFYETAYQPITIQGENFIVDFSGAALFGTEADSTPDKYKNVAIIIRNARNVKIENLNIHRFKVAIYMDNCENIHFRNCDFSYNYRPKLYSNREHAMPIDSIQLSQLGQGELAAVSVFRSKSCLFESLKISYGQHGILLKDCEGMDIFNSILTFNSGIGISLLDSKNNTIRHCRLDYHNRGYSYGGLFEDYGAAGIIMSGETTGTQIGYNSITHCDKGVVQKCKPDKVILKSKKNIFYKNDFSYCPMIGLELCGDSGLVLDNTFRTSNLGISCDGAQRVDIHNNSFDQNHIAVQLKNCMEADLQTNVFKKCQTGIYLQKKNKTVGQPEINYPNQITNNDLYTVPNPFVVDDDSGTYIQSNLVVEASYLPADLASKNIKMRGNVFSSFAGKKPSLFFRWRNRFAREVPENWRDIQSTNPDPAVEPVTLPMNTEVWPYPESGTSSILMTSYGPYDYKYPYLYMISGYPHQLKILGPYGGAWSVVAEEGIKILSEKLGNFPDTLKIAIDKNASLPFVSFKYTGKSFMDQFGHTVSQNDIFIFHYPENRLRQFVTFEPVNEPLKLSTCESSMLEFMRTIRDPQSQVEQRIKWTSRKISRGSYRLTCFDVKETYVCLENEMQKLINLSTPGQSELEFIVKENSKLISIMTDNTLISQEASCIIERITTE